MEEKQIPKTYKTPTISTSDEDLLEISTGWFNESKPYHDELEKISKQNIDYYKGNQTDRDKVPSDMSNAVQNHIFMGVETMVPIMTANPPQFIVEPPEESDTSIKYANSLQKVLSIQYDLKDIRSKGEMLMRHLLLYRYGAWKIYWDENENDWNVKNVRPGRLYFPKVATELPYLMEQLDITAEEFRNVFGMEKFKEYLEKMGQEFDPNNLNQVEGIFTIWEIWNPYLVFWKSGGFIIDKQENPHYNFEKENKNHFVSPKMPYIIASAFRLGNSAVGDTDLIQQTIPIQDVINVTNRLIINNASKMGNGQWLVDPEVMSEEEARTKITNSPGLIIFGSGVANENLLRRDTPPPMPAYIENLKTMAEMAFDNIFGTHSTTRGERQSQETLGGRLLLKQSDLGRIDLLVREYERCVMELGAWALQMIKRYYTGKKTFRYYGETGTNFVDLEPRMVESGTRAVVKSGTTLPTDELTKRNEAIQLWSMGALDPVTLFEKLKFPNPEEAAKRLQAWKTGQLLEQAQIQQQMQQNPQRSVKPVANPLGEIGRAQASITQPQQIGGM